MIASELRTVLCASPLCHGAGQAAVAELLDSAATGVVAARAVLFHQGDPARELMMPAKGLVKVWQINGSGDPTTIHVLGPGDLVGAVAVFRQVPYVATATALTGCTLLSWPTAWVLGLMERRPVLRANALDFVARRNEELVNRLREMATEPVGQRIARALLRLADGTGQAAAGGVEIGYSLSRQDIAELVGTDLYSVSRTLRRWAARGLVAASRLRVVLLNRAMIERIAEGTDPSSFTSG